MIGRISALLRKTVPDVEAEGLLFASGKTVPTDATAGYQTGCIFQHVDGAKGTALYLNEGSVSSCDFNPIAALTAEQEALIGATAGTVTASKAVIVDANKDVGDFRNLDAVNIDAGASGAAGTVDVFPGTASKGKLSFTAANNSGDTTTTIVNAAQAAARTYTIPDAGAAANFVMSEGNATVNGVKTFGSPPVMSGASITAATIPAASLANGAGLAAVVAAGLGASANYAKTDDGTKTLLAANATKDRGCLVVVTVTEAFADGDSSQLILKIGEADTIEKCAASTVFTDATLGSVFVFGFTNTATKAILATLTAAAGTGTGAVSIAVLALPNS